MDKLIVLLMTLYLCQSQWN